MTRRRWMLFTVAVTLAAAGCSDDGSDAANGTAAATAASPEASDAPAETAAAEVSQTEGAAPGESGVPESETGAADATAPVADSAASTAPLVFTATSFAAIELGSPATAAVERLSALLGPPINDTGWFDEQRGCDIGERLRDVTWPNLFLSLSNGPSSLGAAGVEHVLAFIHFADGGAQPQYETDLGIGIDSAVTELRAAYPDTQVLESEIEGPVFATGELGPDTRSITGALSGLDDAATVQSIRIGDVCID